MKISYITIFVLGLFLAVFSFAMGPVAAPDVTTEKVKETFSTNVITMIEHMPGIALTTMEVFETDGVDPGGYYYEKDWLHYGFPNT